jgi:hypothetical protein
MTREYRQTKWKDGQNILVLQNTLVYCDMCSTVGGKLCFGDAY